MQKYSNKSVSIDKLKEIACRARKYLLLISAYNQGIHLGSALSVIDILTVLYGTGRVDFLNGGWDRNWLVLSKGHAIHSVYAIATAMGYISWTELRDSGDIGSILQNHPELGAPGVDVATGSLGQGVSIAVGIALGIRLRGKDYKVYTVIGDGELDEGQVWEALATASHYKLTNFIPIIDHNSMQLDGEVSLIKHKGDLRQRFSGLGYRVYIIDGHNIDEILSILEEVETNNSMNIIIAKTVRGRGVSEIEGTPKQRLSREDALRLVNNLKC
ncbi:MAG: transketolase [Thermoprotei archaeon ex4572_64]|nr:MAG: transketolase [Thermoprotei archaeon ex4572_64]